MHQLRIFIQMLLRLLGIQRSCHLITRQIQKLGTIAIKKPKIKLRWIIFGVGSISIYTINLVIPDGRAQYDPQHYYSDWKIRFYTSLPWHVLSKFTGIGATITVPSELRPFLYGMYVKSFNCNMDEAEDPRLSSYRSFAEFFNRPLKEQARPISASTMVSPADGTVIHFGEIVDGRVECVKGNDYHIDDFLGPINVKPKAGNKLYQMVVYLAPGDYHGFHSPLDWQCFHKVHHPGYLLSVKPSILEWIPLLLCMNERIVLSGTWKHGHFSMTAVAATNVGDIVINDPSVNLTSVKTLRTEEHTTVSTESKSYHKGEHVGEFRLGSTIVLIFEAPPTVLFTTRAGDRVRYGQSMVLKD